MTHNLRAIPGQFSLCQVSNRCAKCETALAFIMQSHLYPQRMGDESYWLNFNIDYYLDEHQVMNFVQFENQVQELFMRLPDRVLMILKKSDVFMLSSFSGICWNRDKYKLTLHFFIHSRDEINSSAFNVALRRFVNRPNSRFRLSSEFHRWIEEDFYSLASRIKQLSLKNIHAVRGAKLPNSTKEWLILQTHKPMCRIYFKLNRRINTTFFSPPFIFAFRSNAGNQ